LIKTAIVYHWKILLLKMDSHVKEAVFEDNIIERGVAGLGSGCEDQASAWWTVRPELSLSLRRVSEILDTNIRTSCPS
jgi:hypothetical protein